MEQLRAAERELSSQLRFLERAIEATGDQQRLEYSVEEEQAVEDRLNEALDASRKAISKAEEWLMEVADPQALATTKAQIAKHKELVKTHTVGVRKVLVAYRQKANNERLNQARANVMSTSSDATDRKAMKAGSAVDVTAALKRTRRVMAEEIERVSGVSKVLDDGRVSLNSSHQEFDSVNAEIIEVRKRLKVLQWQAQQDRMWIAAGIALLASTVLYIVHQRTGLVII